MARLRGNLAVYGLMAILAVISLAVLFRLREQFSTNLEGRVSDLQRVFSNRSLLKTSSESKVSFAEIEAEVAKYENRGDFGKIRVAKVFGNAQRIVYPFYVPALEAAGIKFPEKPGEDKVAGTWLERLGRNQRVLELPLESGGELLGTLQVQVNYGALRTVSMVIWALGAILATSLAFFALQFRRQERVISATTVELEEKRRELVRLERLALAGQLSANILHDLKKPVLNIRNEADEALHPVEGMQQEPPKTILARVREQADFFLTVLREGGFDRFVRARDDREYVDINELLDRSLALVRYEQGNIIVKRNYGSELPAVLAEPVRLIQIFSNLILNACQAMDRRGELRITTGRRDDVVEVRIADNGPGISPEHLPHIFEPFYTTKPEGQGTGLGLYIVRDIVKDLGGEIGVSSTPGATEFRITLPSQP